MSSPVNKNRFAWKISGAKSERNTSTLHNNPTSVDAHTFSGVKKDQSAANKNEKFGNFMGKLLLKSRANNNNKQQSKKPSVVKPSSENLKQRVLTEEPYAGLFRVRKTRLLDQPASNHKIRFSLALKTDTTKEEKCNNKTNLSFKKYRLVDGRQTRWDIKDNGEVHLDHTSSTQVAEQKEAHDSQSLNQHETCTQGLANEPDASSLSDSECDSIVSLQSDDDVLGPWIELGMVDDTLSTKQPTEESHTECSKCIASYKDREPFEVVRVCDRCHPEWVSLFERTFKNIGATSAGTKQEKHSKKIKLSHSKSKASTTPKKTSATAVPPIKSTYQRNNSKTANGKSTNFTIAENTSDNKTKTKHITTGAFMTRKTVQELADPEHGFYPNPYGFYHKQHVQVLNLNGRWYSGTLETMDKGKVKVRYDEWDDQEEWIVMGSRRLKSLPASKEHPTENQPASEIIDVTTVEDPIVSNNEIDLTTTANVLSHKKLQTDYISDMLDKDPTHIFNDNEVFMTRKMARELVDEYGFKPNSFGYRRNRAVAISFHAKRKGERKIKSECIAVLREMHHDQIRVWYPDLHMSEWLPVGSRRLRVLSEEEEKTVLSKNSIDLTIQEVPPIQESNSNELLKKGKKVISKNNKQPQKMASSVLRSVSSHPSHKETEGAIDSILTKDIEQQPLEKETPEDYLTTGAFATRRAMRQLKDDHGFTPNPYSYTYNLAVEVLNIRSGKAKFWERGTLVAMRPGQVKVHYDGWADLYDEWIMVGSRRIRIVETTETRPSIPVEACENELLMAEMNPEITDEVKKNRKHAVVSAQDYQKLGLLVSIEELAAKEAKKQERRENRKKLKQKDKQEDESSSDEDFTAAVKRQRGKMANKKRHKKTNNNHQKECNHIASGSNSSGKAATQIISLRLAQAEASNRQDFVANVYGYDYMQHVTVLHLDKKMYEGRLVRMNQTKVKVHYCGWLDTFDEEIPLGSRRIQPIENDHEVECLEPAFRERYEQAQSTDHECSSCVVSEQQNKQVVINKLNRKRLTLDDVYSENDSDNGSVEYHKDDLEDAVESETWKVYCNQCNVVIKQFRYYCTYCETPSQGYDYQSFELCLRCFDQNFPFWHEHPRSSFAIQSVIDTEIGPRPIKGELVTVWEEDILEDATTAYDAPELSEMVSNLSMGDEISQKSQNEPSLAQPTPETSLEVSKIFPGNEAIEENQGYKYLRKWKRRKVCAFCNDDDDTSEELGQFIGPFVISTFNKNGVEKKRSFWAHDSCARYSPEVFCTPEGKWYNVTLALRRGRGMRCHVCKEKGATIGCFESKCSKSFHLPCSQKPVTYFKNGVIFWCSAHEAYYNKIDTYVNIFNCDGCDKQLADESWFTCVPCSSSYFKSFDLCTECYEKFPADHDHNEDQFEETSFAILKEMEAQKATEDAKEKEEQDTKKKKKPLFPRRRKKLADGTHPVSCCYCGTYESNEWRKGYEGGVIMCSKCFELALVIDSDGTVPLVIDNYLDSTQNQPDQHLYAAAIEDYSHKPYLTRDALSLAKFSESSTGSRLASYEPQQNQLFSLSFDSTYFDIPGRAPRWATHSGTDYHGTWLPQTVRRAILKHTSKDERVLSNFLGRGTDAIECFLLQRRCCGIDINPAAVALSQRNCCFEVPPGLTSAEYRPIIAQADSRQLSGALFTDDSYHHILSHPPYKDCVAYSTHLEGDLSRYTNVEDFKLEYTKVVKESYRLLKMCRRLTLGIGDNREHCFYIPVGFHLIRLYIDHGFELEELVIKRQRYCSAFGLGTYLCVQYDFLVFTHEFIATFKKVPLELADKMEMDGDDAIFQFKRTKHGIPSSAIMRKSVVMGTVWVFKPTEKYKFEQLCTSRMVERFGRDESNWEHVCLILSEEEEQGHLHETETDFIDALQNTTEDSLAGEGVSEYERERLKRIEENNKTLLKLGLISELSEESEDVVHYELMFNKEVYPSGDLGLIVTGHIPQLQPSQINSYRKSMIRLAQEAAVSLATKGFLIIGTQDIRDSVTGKLWPLTMLVLEDIEKEVGREVIKLKEMVVTVPEGYSKDRKKVVTSLENIEEEEEIDIETIENDHLPIVHAIYLIFQKL